MSRLLQVLSGLTILSHTGLATIVSSIHDLPTLQYDFIVVGGENLSLAWLSKGWTSLRWYCGECDCQSPHRRTWCFGPRTGSWRLVSLFFLDNLYCLLSSNLPSRPDGNLNVEVPFFCPRTPNTVVDWNYTTTAQTGLGGRVIKYPRGHVLGGSSSISK